MATATAEIKGVDRQPLLDRLVAVAKRKTAEADLKFDKHGKAIEEQEEEDFGDNVLIIKPEEPLVAPIPVQPTAAANKSSK